MRQILAEVEAIQIGTWLQTFFWLAGGLAGVLVIWRQLKGGPAMPQPFAVRAAHDVATQQDMKEVHGRITREREEVDDRLSEVTRRVERIEQSNGESLDGLRLEMKEDIKGVHDRINEVLRAVGRLEGARQ